MEDLQAFSVIKVGEDDERAAAMLVVAGLVAPPRPQPAVAASAPARTAPPPRAAARPAAKPAPQGAVATPRGTVPSAVVPPSRREVSPWTLPRWARVAIFSTALDLLF